MILCQECAEEHGLIETNPSCKFPTYTLLGSILGGVSGALTGGLGGLVIVALGCISGFSLDAMCEICGTKENLYRVMKKDKEVYYPLQPVKPPDMPREMEEITESYVFDETTGKLVPSTELPADLTNVEVDFNIGEGFDVSPSSNSCEGADGGDAGSSGDFGGSAGGTAGGDK
jgi:hypothetical protein